MDHLLEFGILFIKSVLMHSINKLSSHTHEITVKMDASENPHSQMWVDSSPPSSSQYRIGDAAEQERQEGADKGQYVEGHGEVG
jgi:hypothetical protein